MKPHEVDSLIKGAHAHKCGHYLELAVLLAVEHGASRQEILDLRWQDIDFEDGPTGSIRFFREKNQMERVQDIMPRTREALVKRWEYLEDYRIVHKLRGKRSELVICHPNGSPMKSFRTA